MSSQRIRMILQFRGLLVAIPKEGGGPAPLAGKAVELAADTGASACVASLTDVRSPGCGQPIAQDVVALSPVRVGSTSSYEMMVRMSQRPREEPLGGGDMDRSVVRVGDTVRRPAGLWSHSVDALLRHLNAVGFQGAPRTLGFDEQGRHVLEYIEGEVGMPFQPSDHVTAARRVGELIRDFHDASAGFTPPSDAQWNVVIDPNAKDLIVHHDLAPWNLVLGPSASGRLPPR